MKQIMRILISAFAPLISLAASAVTLPGPLVDDAWLAQNRDEVIVLDIGNTSKSFAAKPVLETDRKSGKSVVVDAGGHIPGAVLISAKDVRVDRIIQGRKVQYMIPARADFEKLIQRWGVRKGNAIVIAPMGASISDINDAARLYWQFKYYGENNVAILDGGTMGWLLAGRPYASNPPSTPPAGDWTAGEERMEIYALSEEVEEAAGRKVQLVDGRDLNQYYGLSKRDYVFGYGHIAGARVYPPELVTQPGNALRFLKPERYRELMAAQGIDPDAPAITYCNSGHLASGVWFVMSEILGNKKASLYDGSMHRWTQMNKPVTTSAK